jgi:hypothetical protein
MYFIPTKNLAIFVVVSFFIVYILFDTFVGQTNLVKTLTMKVDKELDGKTAEMLTRDEKTNGINFESIWRPQNVFGIY